MKSFYNIENLVCCVLQEAKCCLGGISASYVNNVNHGKVVDEDYWKMLQISNYIDVLKAYNEEADCRCTKQKKVINPSKILCLNPEINSIPLGIESVDCFHCLTEREILKIVEVLKIFCSTCNCNCN